MAGGQGERIGGNKPDQMLGGMTLLDRAIAKASGYSPVVAVSARSDSHPLPRGISLLRDDENIQGPIAGLVAALNFASDSEAAHVMIMPCDTPFLPEDLFLRLHDGIGIAGAAMARCAERMHPACSLWRSETLYFLPGYLASGRRSLLGFAEEVGYAAVDWQVDALDPFFNINTIEDLREGERILTIAHRRD
jgi:molybdopterin-guanine dinucleotide biosynthesis protein A